MFHTIIVSCFLVIPLAWVEQANERWNKLFPDVEYEEEEMDMAA